ncbi:MAG: hypothetical protein R2939_21655 [Kofleriaceae bacterium]
MKHRSALDQIWTMARTLRFRLVGFLHYLRGIGALAMEGVGAQAHRPSATTPPPGDACWLLGVPADADRETVKVRTAGWRGRCTRIRTAGSTIAPARARGQATELTAAYARLDGARACWGPSAMDAVVQASALEERVVALVQAAPELAAAEVEAAADGALRLALALDDAADLAALALAVEHTSTASPTARSRRAAPPALAMTYTRKCRRRRR